MKNRLENDIELDGSSVWLLVGRKQFNYSEGRFVEQQLEKAFLEANDLSSTSYELESWIHDWPSEYHLSRKRSQLLRGFDFDKSKRVLEVGCGCGAITRFLGETFDDVVAIEGSLARAKLARLRTKGMKNVAILCAPFQEVKFKERFDIIFCIGVFEYSNIFVSATDPYDFILNYFHEQLTSDGVIVVAIENQFGLKYFTSSREDHTGIMFDGLEGYPRSTDKARTFGYDELKQRLGKYFNTIEFYFPYPDYKTPSCVLSETFFHKVKAGELVANFKSRDYMGDRRSLFDEKLVLLELDKNHKLPFFSNSFLIIAGKKELSSVGFSSLGLIYNTDRAEKLQTVTRFVEHPDGSVWAKKMLCTGQEREELGLLTLHSSENRWIDGLSLQTLILKRVKDPGIKIEDLFDPCRTWVRTLESLCAPVGDSLVLEGKYLDCIWKNTYIRNGKCAFIDLEWEWHEKININAIVIRGIYRFLDDVSLMTDLTPMLKLGSARLLITKIAASLGVVITKADFDEFCRLETEIARIIFASNSTRTKFYLRVFLWNRYVYLLFLNAEKWIRKIWLEFLRPAFS